MLFYMGSATAQDEDEYRFGAYYFDGWTGKYPYHITPSLVDSFPDREPKWGWITSTQRIMDAQIKLASKSGLNFFSFCWYYTGKTSYKKEALNNALELFEKSTKKGDFKFCLLVANHAGYSIKKDDWEAVSTVWLNYFKNSAYLQVDGKPMIVFFSIPSLIKDLGSTEEVKVALTSLRTLAIKNGMKGLQIAACVSPDEKSIQEAEACTFDVLTGYNYHGALIREESLSPKTSINKLTPTETKIWDKIATSTKLPYIPSLTLNWDPRPWANANNSYKTDKYYFGYSPGSVYESVSILKKWVMKNEQFSSQKKIAMIYAWNEYGEGAYLTPTKNGTNYLNQLKKALKKK
jgi:hypothetical protein